MPGWSSENFDSEIINNAKCLQDKIVFDTRNVINGENVYHI